MKLILRVRDVERLMGFEVHQDCFKPAEFVEWLREVEYDVNLMIRLKERLEVLQYYGMFSIVDGNMFRLGLCRGCSDTKCASFFKCIVRAKVA